jgi:plasmid stabilization system protein ParE
MKYRINLTANAKADLREAAAWMSERISPAVAAKWLAGLHKAIRSLEKLPRRCPVASESPKFPTEIRELLPAGGNRQRIASSSRSTPRPSPSSTCGIRHGTSWNRDRDGGPPYIQVAMNFCLQGHWPPVQSGD